MTGRNEHFDIRLRLDERRGNMVFAMMQKNKIDKSQSNQLEINTRGIYPRHKGS